MHVYKEIRLRALGTLNFNDMYKQNGYLDTILATNKILVTSSVRFSISKRTEVSSKTGYSELYLNISSSNQRERIPIGISVLPQYWVTLRSRVTDSHPHAESLNLQLENIEATITNIKTDFHLMRKTIDAGILRREFLYGIPRVYVAAYFEHRLNEKSGIASGTKRRYQSVIEKLKRFNPNLCFHDIDDMFPSRYGKYCEKMGNKKTTIQTNLRAIKDFLREATRDKIQFPMSLDNFKIKRTNPAREYLVQSEVKRIREYYMSDFITPKTRLVVGYFLAACYTGKRVSELLDIERSQFIESTTTVTSKKTGKRQTIAASGEFTALLASDERLFEEKISPEHLNRTLKTICRTLAINKHVTMHTGRHTFATAFLRSKAGDVTDLQIILGHSMIKETMIYVNIIEEESLSSMKHIKSIYD